jgi:CHAT domain
MITNILSLFKDKDSSDLIKGLLKRCWSEEGKRISVSSAFNEKDGEKLLYNMKKCDLIITELNIFADDYSTLDENEWRGLRFLKKVHQGPRGRIPGIIVTDTADRRLRVQKAEVEPCELVSRSSLKKHLDIYIKKSLARPQVGRKTLYVDFKIELSSCKGECFFRGDGFPYEDKDDFYLDKDKMARLIKASKRLRGTKEWPNWKEELQEVGENLMEQIFFNNPKFYGCFQELKVEAGGLENLKIRFIVEEDFHPIVLEALGDSYKRRDYDYWMLKAPIYRRLNKKGVRYPLFADEETRNKPINCLIIESDVSGDVTIEFNVDDNIYQSELSFEKLANVKKECDSLETYLKKNQKEFNIGKIKKIPEKKGNANIKFIDCVRDTLKERPWHLVHYAGHSYYEARNKCGYVFFPGRKGRGTPLEIGSFAKLLREFSHVRFIYLSSCKSSEADFVFALAQERVPAIIGFRWDILDPIAAEHAETFYRHLFKKKSLEYAFLETRKEMHGRGDKHRIWAAPMLIMQVGEERS